MYKVSLYEVRWDGVSWRYVPYAHPPWVFRDVERAIEFARSLLKRPRRHHAGWHAEANVVADFRGRYAAMPAAAVVEELSPEMAEAYLSRPDVEVV